MAPAGVLGPAEGTALGHGHGLRGVLRGHLALALIIQWVFNNTHGSVLMIILTHASWGTFYSAALVGIFPAPRGSYFTVAVGGWSALVAVLLVLTRGRLGYQEGTYDTDQVTAPSVR